LEKQKPPGRTRSKRNLGTGIQFIKIAFDNVKTTIAKEVVLAYPDFTKAF
jgi:hypothetical protein